MTKKVAKRETASKKADWFALIDSERAAYEERERARADRLALLEVENPTQWLVEGGARDASPEQVLAVRHRALGDVARVLEAFGEHFATFGELLRDWRDADASADDAKRFVLDNILAGAAWRIIAMRWRALPNDRTIAPDDYASIRRALANADAAQDELQRANAYATIELNLPLKSKAKRFLASLKDVAANLDADFRGARYASDHPDGAANRQRRALRVLLEKLHGFSPDEATRFVKSVFDAPAKRQRRSAERARAARKRRSAAP